MARGLPLIRFDRGFLRNAQYLVGVDEAGRGCFAGPVVAGAVMYDAGFLKTYWCRTRAGEVNDSKQILETSRESLYEALQLQIERGALRGAAGFASVEEIGKLNILGATRLAMERALRACVDAPLLTAAESPGPLFEQQAGPKLRILVDGRPLNPFPFNHEAVVKGDGCSFAIALASVIAKVTRDRYMRELCAEVPQYGFSEHKGYGTLRHREAIRRHGASVYHRKKFLRKMGDVGCGM